MKAVECGERSDAKAMTECVRIVVKEELSGGDCKCCPSEVRIVSEQLRVVRERTMKLPWDA